MNRQDAKSAKGRQGKRHPYDMQIGPNAWIRYVEHPAALQNSAEIDVVLEPIENFWRALEVHCVAGCCGTNAHSFLPKDIWNACRAYEKNDLDKQLANARTHVAGLETECVFSMILNQGFVREVFLELIDHVASQVNRMKPHGE
jgi:hypothetical protein